jgi:putative oxidoreductase
MKRKITIVARLLLGFTFFASGLTGLLASGYFMTLLKVTETICGLLLLSGFFVPLALVVLAPIVLNIFFTHLFLAPSGLPLAVVIGVLEVYLAFFADPYKQYIRALFVKKA